MNTDANELLVVKVYPGASKNQVTEIGPRQFKIWTTAVAEKGKANQVVIKLLAEHLEVARSMVKIVRGEGSRNKLIKLDDSV